MRHAVSSAPLQAARAARVRVASSLKLRRQANAAEEAVEDDFEGIEKLQQLGINFGARTASQASIILLGGPGSASAPQKAPTGLWTLKQRRYRASCNSLMKTAHFKQ